NLTFDRSAAVETCQCRFAHGVEVEVESYKRGRCRMVLGIRQFVEIDGKDSDLIVMRLVARRRTRTTIAIGPEISAALDRALRHRTFFRIASSLRQSGDISGNIEHDPMPPPAAGRRVRIVNGERETLCA